MKRHFILLPLCLLAFAALPLKAQRWVTEVGIEPAMFYQQYVAMDGGDAVLAVGSMHPSASSSACAEQSGRLLKVRSDGSWIHREVSLPGQQLYLCTGTALDNGDCMVFGFHDTSDSAVPYYRHLYVLVVDSLLRTVAERDYRVDTDGLQGFLDPVWDIHRAMRCARAADGNVVLAACLDYYNDAVGYNHRFRFYEFTPSGDTVASRTQPEYINGLLQSGYSVQTVFPKEDSDGFVFLGRGAFLPRTNDNLGVWSLDRELNITRKSPIYFDYPLFFGPTDLGSDGHWYSGGRFMANLEKWTSVEEPDPEGWLFMLDTLAARHDSVKLPPTDSLSLSRFSFGCSTAYVNDSTVFAVSYTQAQGAYRQVNITLVDSELNILGRKALVDEGWNSQPQSPVALNDGGVVIPINQYRDGEDRLKLVCLTRDDIRITWDAAAESPQCAAEAYPNPADTRINIPLPGVQAGKARLRITDMRGGVCVDRPVRQAGGLLTVDISNLAPGAYTYQITADGGVTASGKFVKQ